jgi:RNA polymerase sporulation-specific sigma factor
MAGAAATRAQAPERQLGTLIAAAQAGDELAFRRLLRNHQRLLEQQAARFYLPGGDADDVLQEARIGFANAVRAYRPERGASFPSFARRCIASQLATALTAATRVKHQPLNDAAHGDDATRSLENLPGGESPTDRALAGELLQELEQTAASFTTLERQAFAHALVGWSSGQTARRLGVAPKSADNALQRARRKVGEWYEEQAA